MDQLWVNYGQNNQQIIGLLWVNYGLIMSQLWANNEPIMGIIWDNYGPITD